ncbi:MAG: PQQ-binding-like beta-propeller repeat protein [Verrucomicrobiota bacterium]
MRGIKKILWQKRLGDDIKAPQNNGATPTPVTDGKHVWFLFGSGDLAALDMDGAVTWSVNLVRDYGNLATKFGYSSSPLLWDGKLYIQILRRDKPYSGAVGNDRPLESLVLAFDPLTGKCLWKHVRKSDAVDESHESYSSPIPFENKTRKELLIQGGDCLTGHDPAIGKETGRCKIAPGGAWRTSPTGADGKILVMSEEGEVVMVSAGANGRILSRTNHDDAPACSTLTAANGRIYVRTASKLTCFGKQP